mmetsp:Transcript_32058/g.28423  ORF Transcript_32058/g.28423 Transcript_32058/m.28423 type:complete len:96 (+) Transcript_32058:756-1043(+)
MYLDNIDNQPNDKALLKRKSATQYTPYGVFLKQGGGLGKSTQKKFVRSDLMFYSKYDQRLVGEIRFVNKKHKKNVYLQKGMKVIILGEDKGKLLT